jgi:prefoldin subunit 5
VRRLLWSLALLLICVPAATAAEEQTELQGLYAALNLLNQEQEALYRQFQMLQDLRRSNDKAFDAGQLRRPQYATEVPNFADVVQAQTDAARRGESLTQQTERLYAQYNELGAQKAQLRQRILDLTLGK